MKFRDKFNKWSVVHCVGSGLLVIALYLWWSDIIFAAAASLLLGVLWETVGDAKIGAKYQPRIDLTYRHNKHEVIHPGFTYSDSTISEVHDYSIKRFDIFDPRGGDWYDILWNVAGIAVAVLIVGV